MPITYELRKLSINGFRGIRELEIDLPIRAPLSLIGANNSGKSTVLDAIGFALEGPKFYNYSAVEFDFFHRANGEISTDFCIDISFSAPRDENLPAVHGVGDPTPLHGCRAYGRRAKSTKAITSRVVLIGADGKPATYAPRTPLRGEAKEMWAEHDIDYKRYTAQWRDVSNCRPEVWHLTPDNLHASLYTWKTGPLHRLSRFLAESFLCTSWKFAYGSKEQQMPKAIADAHRFLSEAVSNFPLWKDDLRPRFSAILSSYVGQQSEIDLRPQIQEIEDWMTQQLALAFSTNVGSAPTPLSSMGHGWQSLVRMAALEILSQIPDQVRERIVLLVEEPETYLHPHLARKFRRVLGSLASHGWVVVVSTHSPSLVRFDENQMVVRLRRDGDVVDRGIVTSSDAGPLYRIQEKLDERGTHELLFAQQIVLCEGKDDVFALKLYLAKLKADLDTAGVTIVDAGSAQSLPDYATLSRHMLIPWVAITDEDVTESGPNPKTQRVRNKLTEIRSARDQLVTWPGSLEKCLDTHDASPEWQLEHLDPLTLEETQTRFPQFCAVGNTVAAFLGLNGA